MSQFGEIQLGHSRAVLDDEDEDYLDVNEYGTN
jgi:hypothetical protein